MPRARVTTGMDLEYDTFGSPADPALLLIVGLSAQMTLFEPGFCQMLADGGRYVIRFDNRDCGLSSKFDDVQVDVEAVILAAFADLPPPPVPYTLSDMAADAVALLDHLGIEQAHILGQSMGGMIAQTIAIEHPERAISLVSMMSQPGDVEVGQPTPEAAAVLFETPPSNRDEYVASSPKWMTWYSRR
ncbi:MAG: alpha/beta fold hydrolase, partial [Actinomycetota bacterium]